MMFKQSIRNFALALTFSIAGLTTSPALAQSTDTSSNPSVVTGTNPEPDYVAIVLALLGVA